MNVVFDTNIFVSGFTRPEGRAGEALTSIVVGRCFLFSSQPILDELLRVFAEKFGWTQNRLEEVRDWFDANAALVVHTETLHILADEPDNRILECALAADADLIVTGDHAMLELRRVGNTQIISLADYLNTVDNLLTSS